MTPWAELLRYEDRRTRLRALMMRYPLWAIHVALAEEPLALTFGNAEQFGLNPGDLVADDQGPCRALADGFRRGGPEAFIAPSAALPGTRNLVLLGERVMIGFERIPIEDVDVPAALAAQEGRCPDGLWHRVHYRGAGVVHPALEAWAEGEEYCFDEPVITLGSFVV